MTTWLAGLDTVTGLVLLAAGVVAWRGRPSSRVGLLLVVAGACWFAGSLVGALALIHRGPLVQLHVSYRPAASTAASRPPWSCWPGSPAPSRGCGRCRG